jgi:hypothetical protein
VFWFRKGASSGSGTSTKVDVKEIYMKTLHYRQPSDSEHVREGRRLFGQYLPDVTFPRIDQDFDVLLDETAARDDD